MQMSLAAKDEDRAAENRQHEIEFKANHDKIPIMTPTARGYRPTKTRIQRHIYCSGRAATRLRKIRLIL